MSTNSGPIRFALGLLPDIEQNEYLEAIDSLDALLAENEQLRAALKAIREVASVAHNGDPWYCEDEGVDAAAAFKLASEALGEAVRG